jgi:cytochrome c oxidase subunit 4
MNQNSAARTCLFAAAALLGLLALTIALAYLNLGPFNTVAALAISAAKAAVIALVFMEARQRGPLIWVVIAAGLFWLGLMFALSMSDFLTRSWP